MNLKFTDFIKITTELIEEEIGEQVRVTKISYELRDFDESYLLELNTSIGKFGFRYNYSFDNVEPDSYSEYMNLLKEHFRREFNQYF